MKLTAHFSLTRSPYDGNIYVQYTTVQDRRTYIRSVKLMVLLQHLLTQWKALTAAFDPNHLQSNESVLRTPLVPDSAPRG